MRVLIFFFFIATAVRGQVDSALTIPMLGIHLGGQLPLADLQKRFGPNLNMGASFTVKSKKNFIYGVEWNYMFGRNVKEDVLTQLKTPEGFVVDNEGYPADIRVTERGMGLHFVFGKVFRLGSSNPNSGLMLTVGGGVLQHKIKLFDAQQKVAAIKGDLVYGYDRLTAGVSISQFIGYLFLSEHRLLNFYFGVESYQAFTKSLRKLNYDSGLPDTRKRFDMLCGLRAGWILPLYKKKPNDYYYY